MEYSLLLYDSLSWKKELVNVERIVKVYLPSYTVSCNSKVKELNNEVIKLNDSSLHKLEKQIDIRIAEILRLNNEHITHVQQMQEILDERDEHVKELPAAGEHSET